MKTLTFLILTFVLSIVAPAQSLMSDDDDGGCTFPIITIHPQQTMVIFDPNQIYYLTAHADHSFVWQISTDNGNTWKKLKIKPPYSVNGDTLFFNFNTSDSNPFDCFEYEGNKYRIDSRNTFTYDDDCEKSDDDDDDDDDDDYCHTFSTHATVFCGSPLPIELVDFSAEEVSKINKLNWVTGSETNTDKFDVQRANETLSWEKIGSVKAMGNSSVNVTYTFYDVHPLVNSNYYRLKQIDLNGDFTYTTIVYVNNKVVEIGQRKYYNLLGVEVIDLIPNTYYIEVVNGIKRKIVMVR
jgi:hypothetical protein